MAGGGWGGDVVVGLEMLRGPAVLRGTPGVAGGAQGIWRWPAVPWGTQGGQWYPGGQRVAGGS